MSQPPLTCSLILAILFCSPGAARSGTTDDPADLCRAAATEAAQESGVPEAVLRAVMLVETGRDGRPWPWTVNIAGQGHWLDSAQEAQRLAAEALENGTASVDLGCFQLNHRWHGAAFPSLADMLDPGQNAAYAAAYLAQHHSETGDWAAAAGAYHSATPEIADRYRARFETVLAGLETLPAPEATAVAKAVEPLNRFPLLVAGQTGRNGSLFPATAGGSRLIGGP